MASILFSNRVLHYALLLALCTVSTVLVLAIGGSQSAASKWIFAVLTIVFNLVLWLEVAFFIVTTFASGASKWKAYRPRGIPTMVVFVMFVTEVFVNTVTCIAIFNPELHFTAVSNTEHHLTVWLRMWNMITVLFGPGGYGRYYPVTLLARAAVGYALLAKLFVFLFVVNTIIASVAERFQAHVKTRRQLVKSKRLHVITDALASSNSVELRHVVYLVVFTLAQVVCLAMLSSPITPPMLARVLYSVLTCIAVFVAFVEFALAAGSRFGDFVEFQRAQPSWYSAVLSILFLVQVYSMIFTAFALYDPEYFFTGIAANTSPFAIWLGMMVVSAVFMVPGGYGLEVTNALSIELVVVVMVFAWVFVLTLVLESVVSGAHDSVHSHEDSATKEEAATALVATPKNKRRHAQA